MLFHQGSCVWLEALDPPATFYLSGATEITTASAKALASSLSRKCHPRRPRTVFGLVEEERYRMAIPEFTTLRCWGILCCTMQLDLE